MTLEEWLRALTEELGCGPPDVDAVLELAREIAHRVERRAVPLTLLLVGLAAGDGTDVPELLEQVRRLLPEEAEES